MTWRQYEIWKLSDEHFALDGDEERFVACPEYKCHLPFCTPHTTVYVQCVNMDREQDIC